ncbi:two-component regulator propeller domain-containing protein [Pedobacter nototheniae]|uniref:ligand-binding sensor domain-containing protein n=1 Tax=Pedobacter nototheniae TaxID=2488994 RepID=UPI00292F1532|nr:two-component regulator propeller domain-containing protein [Pedobacter nototheniae]
MKIYHCILLVLVITGPLVFGQSFPNLKFNQLTVKDGLSTNAVKCSYEDHNGIIWIATSKGLNRYDGTGIKEFKHNAKDTQSICNDVINYIAADPEHHLWLATLGGLSRFDPKTGKAVNFLHNEYNKNSLASDQNCSPFFDSKGRLWLATNGGIQLFNYKKNTFITFKAPALKADLNAYAYNSFVAVREDKTHRLWALSAYGLYLIDEQNKRLILYNQGGTNENVTFYQGSNGTIYLGQHKGIQTFDPQKGTYQELLKSLFNLPGIRVNDINEWTDNQQHKWLCIAGNGGFALMNPKSGRLKEYVSDNLNPSSLNAFNIYHIQKDRQNRLWLSTDNGLNIIDPNLQNFENIPLYQQLKLSNPKIFGLPNNMLETKDRFYLTGYYAKGIYVFDKNWKFLSHTLQVPENAKSALSKSINSIYKDDQNNFWFSTDSGLIKKSGNQYKFFFPPVDTTNKDNLAISKIYKRKDGLFWIRARQNGIYLFDPFKGIFMKQYKVDGKAIDGPVYSCLLDKNDNFWIGSTKGLSYYVPSKDAFNKIIVKKADGKQYPISWITDITEDKDHIIWAVSDVGLVKINKSTRIGLLIDTEAGLPENYLKRILADTLGNLWIPSQQGIIKYDRKKTFTFFNVNNGLPFQYEGHGFFEIDQTGNFLLSFSGFVTRFNPYHVKTNTIVPHVILMEINANGEEIAIQNSDKAKKIELEPGTKIVNIHFALTNYTVPQENKYFYKIGSHAHWQQVKNGDIALGSMPKGKYTLYIKGCNNDELFSPEESLFITVLPYWYETNLFSILCLVAVLSLIVFLWRRRIAFIRKQFLFKQRLSESELKAIRAQMNPHFIFNVLNSIESYIVENNPKTASRLVQKFAALSRLILENSTQSVVAADREWKALKLYAELEVMRFNNQFSCTFNLDPDIDLSRLLLPPMLVQPLIENAIHHGMRNSIEKNNHINVKLEQTETEICFTVEDNGIGIEEAGKFRTFSSIKGKSIGLSSIRDRVDIFNVLNETGSASFNIHKKDEREGRGTVAKLILPKIFKQG